MGGLLTSSLIPFIFPFTYQPTSSARGMSQSANRDFVVPCFPLPSLHHWNLDTPKILNQTSDPNFPSRRAERVVPLRQGRKQDATCSHSGGLRGFLRLHTSVETSRRWRNEEGEEVDM